MVTRWLARLRGDGGVGSFTCIIVLRSGGALGRRVCAMLATVIPLSKITQKQKIVIKINNLLQKRNMYVMVMQPTLPLMEQLCILHKGSR